MIETHIGQRQSAAASTGTKPVLKVVRQGKAVVEHYIEGEYWIMTPDGQIKVVVTHAAAERHIKAWSRRALKGAGDIGVLEIEWRAE